METSTQQKITVQAIVDAHIEKAWTYWTTPEYIKQWNHASDDWHCPAAVNDLHEGGTFNYRMEARDGSMGFDFWGTYEMVRPLEKITYVMGDGRRVEVDFAEREGKTEVTETFEAEQVHSAELQRGGWQAILDNYKQLVESSGR